MIISKEIYFMYELNLNLKLTEIEYGKRSNVNVEESHHGCVH